MDKWPQHWARITTALMPQNASCKRWDTPDHGVGHSLLLLCDAKAPRDQKCKEFKDLGDYLFKPFMGLS
jgi:hypothetical protein